MAIIKLTEIHASGPLVVGLADVDGATIRSHAHNVSDVVNYGHVVARGLMKNDARRLVACFNVCEGTPTEVLEDAMDQPRRMVTVFNKLSSERDALLSALLDIRPYLNAVPAALADAAIAKATGAA